MKNKKISTRANEKPTSRRGWYFRVLNSFRRKGGGGGGEGDKSMKNSKYHKELMRNQPRDGDGIFASIYSNVRKSKFS